MRSFAVVTGLVAAANAAAYGYPAYNTTSVAPPAYVASSSAPAYPVYPVASSSKAPEYPAYPVASSSAPAYPVYPVATPVYSTKVVTGVSTVCNEPTTITYGTKTYTVKSSTTIIDKTYAYTTTYEVKPTPTPAKPTSVAPPAGYSSAPPAPIYPSAKNATTPYPTGVKPSKPATPEFTGAAAQAGVGLMAVAGALAAFL